MAERFNKARRYTRRPGRPDTRGLLLFLLPLPLLPAIVVALARGLPGGVVGNTVAAVLYFGGAVLMRRGLVASRSPRTGPPQRLIGGLLVALATFSAAVWGAGHTFLIAGFFAAGSLLGCYLTYGFEARRREMPVAGGYSAEEVAAAIEEAEKQILGIEDARR